MGSETGGRKAPVNYLQRFSKALKAVPGGDRGDPRAEARRLAEARRMAGPRPEDWLTRIDEVARHLPPRGRDQSRSLAASPATRLRSASASSCSSESPRPANISAARR